VIEGKRKKVGTRTLISWILKPELISKASSIFRLSFSPFYNNTRKEKL
jgi:hypothetical protein